MAIDFPAELRESADGFARLLAGADLDAVVAACPGWTLRDLAHHLGGIHAWAAYAVAHGEPGEETRDGPWERAELVAWYRDRAESLTATLVAAGPDAAAWTFGPPRTVAFWWRRQAHETRMHLGDARSSQGLPDVWSPGLAWDGVLEVAEVFHPRQVRLGRTAPLPVTLRLVPSDVDAEVTLGHGTEVLVDGTAQEILELLWHRRTPPAGLTAYLGRALTP